jgi:hypothetical protein
MKLSTCHNVAAIPYDKVPDHIANLPSWQVLQFEMQTRWKCSLCGDECQVKRGIK